MNPELSSCSSSTLDSIRKAGIGRRGGVKVRGGRLPPVQIHNAVTKKKSVAPKIPQKRSRVKKEEDHRNDFDVLPFKHEENFRGERGRDHKRGRGRGSKVYIQTEGTLFGEGPTFMVKKEKQYSSYERISLSKSSKNSGIKREEKIDPGSIDFLLEFDYAEDESDTENDLKPIKYPVSKAPKRENKLVIKQELKQEFKQEIGFENLSIEEIKPFIKKEPVSPIKNNFKPMTSKYFTPITDGTDNLVNNLMEDMKKREDVGVMFLLQLPDTFPFFMGCNDSEIAENEKQATSIPKEKVQNDKNKMQEEEDLSSKVSARDLQEGFIGKLQFLKSGKVRLLMGSVKIYLEEGSSDFASEAVSIPIQGKSGDLIVLGKITRKVILQPKFNDIADF